MLYHSKLEIFTNLEIHIKTFVHDCEVTFLSITFETSIIA